MPTPSFPLDQLPETARTVFLAVNPKAGDGSRRSLIEHLEKELADRDLKPQRFESLDQLADQVPDALSRGELRAVIAAGGDGTAAEIVNRTPPGTPLAVFPLGTENLLARFLKIDRDCAAMAEMVASGRVASLDAACANGRVFLLESSIGFPAEVVRQLHAARSGNISHWTYAKPILNSIRGYTYPSMRVYYSQPADDRSNSNWSEPIECSWAFVFNIPRYGGGLKFAPAADPNDGQLDLCTFRQGGLFTGLKYLAAIVQGSHESLQDFKSCRGPRFRIESADPIPYELDGDPGGMLPLEVDVLPQRLRLLVPPQWSLSTNPLGPDK